MKYIIDEDSLKMLANDIYHHRGNMFAQDYIGEFLNNKQPVEMIASGEVTTNALENLHLQMTTLKGKNIKIYIEVQNDKTK